MNNKSATMLMTLLLITGCDSSSNPAVFIKVENIAGIAYLNNTSADRAIRVTYSCGGYTSQTVTLKAGEKAVSDLGNGQCSRATVTSARFLDAND